MDYGARMYDGQIGRFFRQDRFCEKYLMLSPYQYVANNPIKSVDINGDSIWYTIQGSVITLHATIKIINKSGDNINMQRAADDIAEGIKKSFTGGTESEDGKKYTFETDIQLNVAKSMEDVASSDHLYVIADKDPSMANSTLGVTSTIGGKVMHIRAEDYSNDNWFSNTFMSNNIRSAIHEFGHAAGLNHGEDLMEQGGQGRGITDYQRGEMYNKREEINKLPNSQNGSPYPIIQNFNSATGKMEMGTVQQLGFKYTRK